MAEGTEPLEEIRGRQLLKACDAILWALVAWPLPWWRILGREIQAQICLVYIPGNSYHILVGSDSSSSVKNTTLFIKPFGIKCALFEALEEYVTYVLKSREHLPTLPTSAHWWQTVLSTKPGFLPTVVSVSSFSLRLWKVTPDVMLNRDRNPRVCTASSYTLEGQFQHAISIYFLREAPVGLSSRNPLQQPVWYVTLY